MQKRLFYLDNLKSIALLAGILFHSSIVYAENVGYPVKNHTLSWFFTGFVHFIHVFRMPLFFYLSGFFSELVLEKKGVSFFLESRFKRILLPAAFGVFFLAPVEGYIISIQKMEGNVKILTSYFNFFSADEFTYSHIWFLVYLLIYSFIVLIFYFLKEKTITGKLTSFASKKSSLITLSFFALISLLFVFPVNFFYTKDDSFLTIKPVSFLYFFSFYLAGIFSFKINFFYKLQIPNLKSYALTILSVSIAFFLFLYLEELDPYWMKFSYSFDKILLRFFHLLLDSFLAWSLIVLFLILFRLKFESSSHFWTYIKDAGLSIYLVHHPISLTSGYFLKSAELDIFSKFFIHNLVVFSSSFIFYQFIIKKSFQFKAVFYSK